MIWNPNTPQTVTQTVTHVELPYRPVWDTPLAVHSAPVTPVQVPAVEPNMPMVLSEKLTV